MREEKLGSGRPTVPACDYERRATLRVLGVHIDAALFKQLRDGFVVAGAHRLLYSIDELGGELCLTRRLMLSWTLGVGDVDLAVPPGLEIDEAFATSRLLSFGVVLRLDEEDGVRVAPADADDGRLRAGLAPRMAYPRGGTPRRFWCWFRSAFALLRSGEPTDVYRAGGSVAVRFN